MWGLSIWLTGEALVTTAIVKLQLCVNVSVGAPGLLAVGVSP